MFYDVISELEIAVDRNAWENWYAKQDSRWRDCVKIEEVVAEFLGTYTENIDYIDWEYTPEQFRVCLNDAIEETIAMKNQWRDYTDPEEEMDDDEEDYRRDPYSPWNY